MRERFEQRLDEAIERMGEESLAVTLGDSHKSAHVKGVRDGLVRARELYRQFVKDDIDGV